MGIKLFRNGVHSGNIHAMLSLESFNTTNFFEHTLTNHIMQDNSLGPKLASLKFASGKSKFIFTVGLRDFATYDKDGVKVDKAKYPFQVFFEPQVSTPDRVPRFPANQDENRAAPFQADLVEALSKKDQLLFKVYAYS